MRGMPYRCAYLGPAGTFTEAALRTLDDAGHAVGMPCPTIQATLDAVRTGAAQRAVDEWRRPTGR